MDAEQLALLLDNPGPPLSLRVSRERSRTKYERMDSKTKWKKARFLSLIFFIFGFPAGKLLCRGVGGPCQWRVHSETCQVQTRSGHHHNR